MHLLSNSSNRNSLHHYRTSKLYIKWKQPQKHCILEKRCVLSLYAKQVSMHLTLGPWFLKSRGSVKSITDPYPASPLWSSTTWVLKIVNCHFLVLWVSKVVIGNFFSVHLLVLHLQTEDAPFEPCKFQDEDQKTLFEVSVSPVL